jgi:hypothetical protein
VAAWALWALALAGLATVPRFEHLARQAGRPELTQLNASTIPYLLAIVVAASAVEPVTMTLAYGLLTVLLGGGCAVVVLGLGQVIGRGSSLVVAAATLAVAAAFQPARRRVQAAVDRRFNRRRYDAAQIIAAFGDRLRQQVDLDTLSAELLVVVGQTRQPTSVSLWLRPSRSPEVPAATGTA